MPLDCIDPGTLARLGLKSLGQFLCARDLTCKFLETAVFVPEAPESEDLAGVCYVAVEAARKGTKDFAVTAMMVEMRYSGPSPESIASIIHHEAECPEHVDCPLDILGLLSPTDCKQTLKWRRNCLKGAFAQALLDYSLNPPHQPA